MAGCPRRSCSAAAGLAHRQCSGGAEAAWLGRGALGGRGEGRWGVRFGRERAEARLHIRQAAGGANGGRCGGGQRRRRSGGPGRR